MSLVKVDPMEAIITEPFSKTVFEDLQAHVKQIRRLFDWPGIPYHDAHQPPNEAHDTIKNAQVGERFNRWFWHRPPLLHSLHHSAELIAIASKICGQQMKPSYVFLSMYGPHGVCPVHKDRPQCQFTMDLQINSDGDWPIYVDDKEYILKDGQALCYSGSNQEHYRLPMVCSHKIIQHPTYSGEVLNVEIINQISMMDLGFFHFVPADWQGKVD